MLVIEQILQRKDVPAVAVAVVVGMATVQFLGAVTGAFASVVTSPDAAVSAEYGPMYGAPTLAFALQVLLLEALLRLVIFGRRVLYKDTGR